MAQDLIECSIKVINDGRFLVATMPNGDVIPMQIDCIVSNSLDDKGKVGLTVTLKSYIKTEDFEILKPNIDKINK